MKSCTLRRCMTGCLLGSGLFACGAVQDEVSGSTGPATTTALVSASGPPPQSLTVRASDYAFVSVADSVPAGHTLITLDNRGKQRHELPIGRLRPGVDLGTAADVARRGADPASVIDTTYGIVVAAPGSTSADTLKVFLEDGRWYVIVCFLRDAPGKPEHVALGMIGSFVAVRPD